MATMNSYAGKQEALNDPIFTGRVRLAALEIAVNIINEAPATPVNLNRYVLARDYQKNPNKFISFTASVVNAIDNNVEYDDTLLTDTIIANAVSGVWNAYAETIEWTVKV